MIAQQIVNGLILGSTYALVAIGYTLVFGVLNLLNFAHANVFALGGFLLFSGLVSFGLPFPVGVLLVLGGGVALGYLTEMICFRPAAGRKDELTPAIASIAFGLVLTEIIAKVWGSEPLRLPPILNAFSLNFDPVQVSGVQVLILALSLALMAALDLLLRRTRLGFALRAVAENREVAQLLGIDIRATVVLAFALSGALASLAGVLVSARLGLADPNIGLSYGLRALAVMVIGGLGNVRGAMLAGLLVGFVDVFTLAFLSEAYSGVGAWVLLILVLLFKPSGLLGTYLQRESI
jgi:branched-chain amino acid transport system permease protein